MGVFVTVGVVLSNDDEVETDEADESTDEDGEEDEAEGEREGEEPEEVNRDLETWKRTVSTVSEINCECWTLAIRRNRSHHRTICGKSSCRMCVFDRTSSIRIASSTTCAESHTC